MGNPRRCADSKLNHDLEVLGIYMINIYIYILLYIIYNNNIHLTPPLHPTPISKKGHGHVLHGLMVHGLFIRHLQGLGIVHLAETRDTLRKNLGVPPRKRTKKTWEKQYINMDMVVLLVDSYSIFW